MTDYAMVKDFSNMDEMMDDDDAPMKKVTIGDWVGFKADIEQYGCITKIDGHTLTLENSSGFSGDYIGGEKITTMDVIDCWV